MASSRSPLATITGIALIVLPLLALGLKMFSFGWYMVMLMFGPGLVLIIGYALQLVIAIHGFLSRRSPILTTAVRGRATAAAWITSIAVVVLGVFMPDGGDTGHGSTLQVWLGAYSGGEGGEAMHAATDGLTAVIAMIAAIVWAVAFVWLVVEWIAGLVLRRRARLNASATIVPA